MRAVERISEEHARLLELLDFLDELMRRAAREDALDGEAAALLLEELERFADGAHQDKEELALFPLLARRSAGRARTLVGRLLGVHAGERRLLEELRRGFEAAAYGDATSRDLFVSRARRYVDLQRRHALAEERLLLPLAERLLRPEDDERLLALYERIDARHRCGAHGIELLRARFAPQEWLVPQPAPRRPRPPKLRASPRAA